MAPLLDPEAFTTVLISSEFELEEVIGKLKLNLLWIVDCSLFNLIDVHESFCDNFTECWFCTQCVWFKLFVLLSL